MAIIYTTAHWRSHILFIWGS